MALRRCLRPCHYDHLLLQVSAAFLLFPETIEIDPNSRRRRSVEAVEDNTLTPGLLTSGLCSPASSRLCALLERVLLSIVSNNTAHCS